MSTIIETARKATPPPPDNPWYYGWRDEYHLLPDGTSRLEQVPLTLEDTLHPHEGDNIVESDIHDLLRGYLATVFRSRTADDPTALILSDTAIYWDDPRLPFKHHCPDVAAIFGIKKRLLEYSSFSVGAAGVRPRLIVEVVSPNTRVNDVETKMDHYHRVEIPMYVIADRERLGDPWSVIGYHWRPDMFIPMVPNSNGRLWLEAVGVWLGAVGTRLVCYDRFGAEISDYQTILNKLDAEKAAREAAEARTKELEAELARLRGQ